MIPWAVAHQLLYFGILQGKNWRRKWQPTPVFLPGESQGQGSLVGCHLRGCTESDMTGVTAAAELIYLLTIMDTLIISILNDRGNYAGTI